MSEMRFTQYTSSCGPSLILSPTSYGCTPKRKTTESKTPLSVPPNTKEKANTMEEIPTQTSSTSKPKMASAHRKTKKFKPVEMTERSFFTTCEVFSSVVL